MTETRFIHCCCCQHEVAARLTDGSEIYPHRADLHDLPFWKCDTCGNFVGCHHKTKNRTQPLGNIPTPELRNARNHIHKILDPLWSAGNAKLKRREIYDKISQQIGRKYHTAEIKTIEEARIIYALVRDLKHSLNTTL